LLLPIMGGVFVLVVAGLLGTVFTLVGTLGTIIIGMSIVLLSPMVAGVLIRR
ncbi:MAG: hypothetical protein IH860_10390, partial [Chloroflexi bacterium]|nr:hypothetical protein [Chloroflexota bacterium]